VYGAKFEMMYSDSEDDSRTVLYLDKLNSFNQITL
jgi:inward rectifier potassium channel